MGDSRDSRITTLVTGSGILLVGIVFELGLAFVAKVIMAQLLGKVTYGSVSIGIIMAANLSTIFVLGLDTGIARYLPRQDNTANRRGVLISAFQLVTPVVVALGAGLFVFAEPIAQHVVQDRSVAPMIRIFAVATPFAAILKLSVGGIQGTKLSLPKVYVRNIIEPLARFTFIICALYIGYQAYGIGFAYLGGYIVGALAGLYFLVRSTSVLSGGPWTTMHRELISFSSPLAVVVLANVVVSGIGIDSFMIAYFANTGDVGYYNVIVPTAKLMTVIVSAVSFLFMPMMSELHAEGANREMRRLFKIVTKWIVIGTLPIFAIMIFFPSQFITLTFGLEYSPAALPLSVLAVGYFVHSVFGPNEQILTSIGETRLIMYDNLIAAVVNITLNLLLIPQYSLLGAAVGTTVAYLTVNILYGWHVYALTKMQPFSDSLVRPVMAALSVLLTAYLLAISFFTVDGFELIALTAVLVPVYVFVVLRAGAVEEEEIKLVLSLEEQFDINLGPFKRAANWAIGD